MAWETRGMRRYYYRSFRQNGRVLKKYLGRGLSGWLAASEDLKSQDSRRQILVKIRKLDSILDGEINAYRNACRILLHANYLNAGYRQSSSYNWRASKVASIARKAQ